jgi:hypothetical protein
VPWRFIVCDKFNNAAAWEKAFSCLVEANRALGIGNWELGIGNWELGIGVIG